METGVGAEVRIHAGLAPGAGSLFTVCLAMWVLLSGVFHRATVADVSIVKDLVRMIRAGSEDRQVS